MSKPRPTIEERIEKLRQGYFGPAREINEAEPIEPTPMLVAIDQIKEYDRNPRRERNPAYDLIKESIRQRGFSGALPITRRPGEALYMVAEGGNTVLQILKTLYAEAQDPRFHEIHCVFEPWVSESETLIAHLVENDARGELAFIDRARAVRDLRTLLEQETGAPLSATKLAGILRDRGYAIDQPTISRLDYTIATLLPAIPVALRAGMGRPAIERIRKLEKMLATFLADRGFAQPAIDDARAWFLVCLARHDREDWVIEPVEHAIDVHLAEICGESVTNARANLASIDKRGTANGDAAAPLIADPPALHRASPHTMSPDVSINGDEATGSGEYGSDTSDKHAVDAGGNGDANVGDVSEGSFRAPPVAQQPVPGIPSARAQSVRQTDLPRDVKSLRARMWTLATQLAQRHGLGECILICTKGCGFLVDFPEHPPFAGPSPESSEEALSVMLWWMLVGLADEWPQGPGLAPALALLEEARIYPTIRAVAEGEETTPTRTLVPRVGYPPSLAIAARELLVVLDIRDYDRLIELINARRALETHCRRLGTSGVWDL